ncbi:MAG: DNA polymerase/3'-5' exonuclease PolX [Thermoleophilia bacterium]|nr:DNA polymerase/3'-5' exonuclease PolX [Thermoleophilia bacterium]
MPTNAEIANILETLAELMELDGVNKFRFLAVQKAARRVAEANFSIEERAAAGTLTEIPDIGDKIAAKIEEIAASGKLGELEEYFQRYPPALVEMERVQGIGPRTARRVWEELGVSTIAELEAAARDGSIAGLPGMGQKSADNILKAIQRLKARGDRLLLGEVLPVAEEVAGLLREITGAHNVSCAGSVRRMKEMVKDLDIIATSTEPELLTDAFSALPMVAAIIAHGPTKCSVRSHTGLQIDLRVVPDKQYGNLLQHFTGSKEHNVALRELAISKGLKVSEYGVEETSSGKVHECATEAEVYQLLGLQFIPPELREDSGEIEAAAAGSLPDLIKTGDLKGDLHLHSDWSDGHATIMEMALAAKDRGYQYIAVSDHTQSLGMVHGLTPERLEEQLVEIARVNKELDSFHVFASAEVDVKSDGSLDLPDESLARLDFVTVSIHSGFNQDRGQIMERLRAAMENPYVRSIGHPTGRLINRREPYEVDMEAIIDMAARTGTALEINSHFQRLDLNDLHARAAQAAGVMLVINSDAHRPEQLDLLRYGVATARRGWIEAGSVLNTLGVAELESFLKKPKSGPTR